MILDVYSSLIKSKKMKTITKKMKKSQEKKK